MIAIEDFSKIELRIATILRAEEHPDADRLYILTIDAGEDSSRQIVAGIRNYYQPEQLIGKKIVIVANLQKAVIRGVESHGMLLAAKDSETLALIAPELDIKSGTPVS